MRDYTKITSQFWSGKTGRAIRGDMQTQVIAVYLLSNRHTNMIGVYECPIDYIAFDTGSPLEGASKGLQRLIQLGFCSYDSEHELLWVHEMAAHQIGEELKQGDNRVSSVQKHYEALPECAIKKGFYHRYQPVYHLTEHRKLSYSTSVTTKPLASPFEAPLKPLRSQEQEQELEQEKERETPQAKSETPKPDALPTASPPQLSTMVSKRGSRLANDWTLPDEWRAWALQKRPDMTSENIDRTAELFKSHWISKAGKDACKLDWFATWQNWVLRENAPKRSREPPKRMPFVQSFANVNYHEGVNADGTF